MFLLEEVTLQLAVDTKMASATASLQLPCLEGTNSQLQAW